MRKTGSEDGRIKIDPNSILVSDTKEPGVHSYREQFERLLRSYARLESIYKGRAHDTRSENYRDEVYTFFSNCYHLKDWLKNDPGFSGAKEVENYINANQELQLCADICNAHKHFRLDKPRSTEQPRVGGQKIDLKLGAREIAIKVKFTIDTGSGPIDAFDLATKCLELWKAFLVKNGDTA